MDSHIVWHKPEVTKADRHRLNGHKSGVLWFTGLSGSGKSTLAKAVDVRLYKELIHLMRRRFTRN